MEQSYGAYVCYKKVVLLVILRMLLRIFSALHFAEEMDLTFRMTALRNVATLLNSAYAEGFFQSAATISHPAASKKQIT